MAHRAVIFDLGGVVFPSPFDVFAAYEAEHGLPDRFLRTVVATSADHGAWARLERGELDPEAFGAAFAAECAAAGATVDGREILAAISRGFEPRPEMLGAIRRIRAQGLRTAALTNNWLPTGDPVPGNGDTACGGDTGRGGDGAGSAGAPTVADRPHDLGALGAFDVVVESAREGLRKPDPAIYRLTCTRLGVAPGEVVFLDDLGVNLKPARALGMTTIKVTDPHTALDELAGVLGFPLR